MQRDRVVDLAADLARGEESLERVAAAAGHAEGELVPDALAGEVDRQQDLRGLVGAGTVLGDAGHALERGVVEVGVARARAVIFRQVRELQVQQRGLEGIHAEVGADLAVVVFRLHAVDAQDARAFGERVVLRGDQAGVAHAAEVLGREETGGAEIAGGHRAAALPAGAHRLGGVFDHADLVSGTEGAQGVEVAGLAEEVDRHDRRGARRDLPGGVFEVDVEVVRVDVDPDRGGAEAGDGAGGGEEGEGREEDLVALADAERHQREQERVGAGGDPEGVLHAEEGGAVLLEGLEARTHDEHVRAQHLAEGGLELGLEGAVLRAEIKERDVRHGARGFSHRRPARATSFSAAAGAEDQEETERGERQRPELPGGETEHEAVFG